MSGCVADSRKFFLALAVAVFAIVVSSIPAQAEHLQGRVIAVADGDSFTLLTRHRTQIAIRLAEIDAPERGRPYGNRAKQALSDMIFGKNIQVVPQTTDAYGRLVGRPYIGNIDVCEEMVRSGAAWAYRRYLRDPTLLGLEAEAREHQRGVWGLSESQQRPPWEWRRFGNVNESHSGCDIKGNINSKGDRIYHVPGSRSYGATRINEANGERWFCNEAEARSAGWRAPYQ